jgi:hypothetical protein
MVDYFATRLAKRTEEFRTVHHQLYLGGGEGNFKPFSDPRLVNYWCVGCTPGQQLPFACSVLIMVPMLIPAWVQGHTLQELLLPRGIPMHTKKT